MTAQKVGKPTLLSDFYAMCAANPYVQAWRYVRIES